MYVFTQHCFKSPIPLFPTLSLHFFFKIENDMNPFTSGSDKHTKILKVERGIHRLGESMAGLGLLHHLYLFLADKLFNVPGRFPHLF